MFHLWKNHFHSVGRV